jgi:HTH-type transcriptional regulator / antitoxin HigA
MHGPARPSSRSSMLSALVDAYERRAFPIQPPGPVAAIRARCEQLGWTRRELEPLIGSRARVSEIHTGRRSLTLPMIRNLHAAIGIPADVLISEAPPPRSPRRSLGRRRRTAARPTKNRSPAST